MCSLFHFALSLSFCDREGFITYRLVVHAQKNSQWTSGCLKHHSCTCTLNVFGLAQADLPEALLSSIDDQVGLSQHVKKRGNSFNLTTS